jgi:hypothetical protein
MKPSNKRKLVFNRDTLRSLATSTLRNIAGGTGNYSYCNCASNACDPYTDGCGGGAGGGAGGGTGLSQGPNKCASITCNGGN